MASNVGPSSDPGMSSFQEILAKLQQLEDEGKLRDIMPVTGTPFPIAWNDELYDQELTTHCTPIYRPSPAELLTHAVNFLKFYGGTPLKETVLLNTVKALWAGLQYEGKYLFNDPSFISTDAQHKIVPQAELQDPNLESWTFNKVVNKIPVADTSLAVVINKKSLVIDTKATAQWYQGLKTLLISTDNRDSAIFYLGYLSIVYCRLVTKTPCQVAEYTVRQTYNRLRNLTGLYQHNISCYLACTMPMAATSAGTFAELARKGGPKYKSLILPLVQAYRFSDDIHAEIFKSGAILSLAYTGLGLFTWWDKAVKTLGCDSLKLLPCFDGPEFPGYVKAMRELTFLLSSTKRDDTGPFARLIRDDAWATYTIHNHPLAVAVCVAICTGSDPKADIWSIASLKSLSPYDIKKGCTFAKSIKIVMMKEKRAELAAEDDDFYNIT